jgi:hypothetical protein
MWTKPEPKHETIPCAFHHVSIVGVTLEMTRSRIDNAETATGSRKSRHQMFIG